jgi:HAD superfamily hydrolase (TIGR01509 family)
MALETVLFDMDGVIVDTEPLHKKAYFKTFDDLGIVVSNELYASFTGASTKKVCEKLIEKFNLKENHGEITSVKRAYFKHLFDHDADFDLIPGVLSLIQHYHSHGVKLVLASSASNNTINWVFERFQLDPYFVGKISGADLQESKPHPEIFIKAAEIAGTKKENCMVIEDSTNGILAAHRAGIFCAAYKSFNSHQQDYALANVLVDDYADLEIEKLKSHF